MSNALQTYSCTMPERRSKDHIHRLLFLVGIFTASAVLSVWTTYLVLPYPILPWVSGVLALVSVCAAALCLVVWVSVR